MILLGSAIVAAAVIAGAWRVVAELRAVREDAARDRVATILQLFAPAVAAAQHDPRAFLVWQPFVTTARAIMPAEFAALERAAGRFPFSNEQLQAAHAQWTTDWLAFERAHDAEFKLKAAAAVAEVAASDRTDLARGKLEGIEREKLDTYQRRYAEYVRVAKGLQALIS